MSSEQEHGEGRRRLAGEQVEAREARAPEQRGSLPPLWADGPLLSVGDVACYLRLTPGAVRRLLQGGRDRSEEDTELSEALRSCRVILSPHRHYFDRRRFLGWLGKKIADASDSSSRA